MVKAKNNILAAKYELIEKPANLHFTRLRTRQMSINAEPKSVYNRLLYMRNSSALTINHPPAAGIGRSIPEEPFRPNLFRVADRAGAPLLFSVLF